MFSTRAVLCVGLTLGLLLAPPAAEARFGKRSKPAQSESQKDDKVHDAVPVGHEDSGGNEAPSDSGSGDDGSSSDGDTDSGSYVIGVADIEATAYLLGFLFGMGNHQQPLGEGPRLRHAAPFSFRLGMLGGPMNGGTGVDVSLGLDVERFGLEVRGTGLKLPADDGTPEADELDLMQFHASWALIAEEWVRIRAEAGVSRAEAPDLSLLGPSFGGSLELCLAGPLDVEARAQVTPFPYRQLDASAALALHLGALMVRGGYRTLLLDDAGLVDGVVHREALTGPFFGMGLTF